MTAAAAAATARSLLLTSVDFVLPRPTLTRSKTMDTMEPKERTIPDLLYRVAVGALIFFVALLVGISAAHAMDLVPQAGITKSADGSGTKSFIGLSLRGNLIPMFKHETSVGYRSDEVYGGLLKTTTVPITESVYFSPISLIYAGVGGGMYVTTLTYKDVVPIPNSTEKKFGFHLGGGINFPLAPMISVDLNTKYVFMDKQATALQQGSFDPSFWSTVLGVAIHF